MFAIEHGVMNKVIIMNDYKLFTVNVYDTGFISPKPHMLQISHPVEKESGYTRYSEPAIIKGA